MAKTSSNHAGCVQVHMRHGQRPASPMERGAAILNTIGYFIDKCPDQGLLDEIKRTLIPIQEGKAQAQPFFCPTLDKVEEFCAQQDPMDMDEGGELDMGVNIDPDLGF